LGKAWKAHTANPKGKTLFQSGDEVALRFAPDDVVIVPAEGGET
jgi:hypothetical protein